MTIDREALQLSAEKKLAAIGAINEDQSNRVGGPWVNAPLEAVLDAILPEVQADAYKLGWDDARREGCSDEFAAGLWDEGLDAALPFSEIRADSFVRNQLHARNPYRKAASE